MRFAIEDLVFKLFGEGPSVSKTPTQTPSPSPSITAPTHNKVKEHIQRDMDGMGLGNYMENAEDDVPTASRSISHDSDVVAKNTMRLDAPMTSTMRSDAPAFRPTFSAPPSEQYLSTMQAPTRRRDPSPTSEPDIADYYDPEMFQTRRMTRSMSIMGENLQNSNKLDPPPKPPDCSTLNGGKSSPTTTQTSPITPISDSSPNSIDLSLKNHGTNSKTVLNQGRKTYATAVSGLSQAERSSRKSFASVIQGIDDSSTAGFAAKEAFIHMGESAIVLTESEEATLADPYKYTLVGKFPHRKPTMRKVREIFSKFGFHGCFEVGLIDTTHILIHLTHEEDHSRLFLKPSWYIDGCPMRVLKWTCDFTPEQETPIVPVWVSFPLLPVHLRAKGFLFALSRVIGMPLRIDEATTDLRRPSEPRVCIEVNLGHKLPDRVWIERAGNRGFWQTVIYEKRPIFCFSCKHLGHSYDQCATVPPPPPPAVVAHPPVRPPITRTDKDKGKVTFVEPKKQWVPVSVVPSVLPTATTAIVTESESTSTVPTSIPITVDPEVPLFIHSVAEPTPNAPIEVPISPIITSIAPMPTATTEAPPDPTQINSPPLKTRTDGSQSA
ncbi:uncharacterized protein LOC111390770 [Olea europaea var. sylvestris]|uniref:uncharacterized protein LOC111390770 n=1 Tax=Olea europaea var. sylvestris TaxID=158386 RepID=UPI000C1D870C|nr:uncharacterized protein LOC111390770 [Olea europaea var. sylvestris]